MMGRDFPRAWVVRIELDHVPDREVPRHAHAEELVFTLGLLAFLLWVTLRWLA
jgi:hypothetical protein